MTRAFSPLAVWLPILGAVVAIAGGFLPWFSRGGESSSGWDVQFVGLFTHEQSDFDLKTAPVLFVMVVAALPLLTGRALPRLAGAAVAGVATNIALLGFTLYFALPEPCPDLGIGLAVVLTGGVIMATGALLAPRAARPVPRVA